MTPATRTALIARAKALAVPVSSCVAASLRPDHLLPGLSRDELTALVIVLAEAADPVRLHRVVRAPDGPGPVSREVVLRGAHAEASRLRKAGLEVPFRLRLLDSEYRRERKRAAREASRAA